MSTRVWSAGTGASFISSYWWVMLLRGVLAVLIGFAVIMRPGISAGVLALLFGAFVFATGILAVVASIAMIGSHKQWWAVLIEGLLGITVGLISFFWPAITVLSLLLLIAIWAVLTGIFQIAGAISRFGPAEGRWLHGLSGVLSVILGVLLFMRPAAGIVAVVWLFGLYAIVLGIDQIVLGSRMHKLEHWLQSRT